MKSGDLIRVDRLRSIITRKNKDVAQSSGYKEFVFSSVLIS